MNPLILQNILQRQITFFLETKVAYEPTTLHSNSQIFSNFFDKQKNIASKFESKL